MTHQTICSNMGFRQLRPLEIEAVGGGNWGNPTVWDNPIPGANGWDHSKDDFMHRFQNWSAGFLGQTYGDADGDGFNDSYDRMQGGDDGAFHLHRNDGTIMGQNSDGTYTLYDQNGKPAIGVFELVDTSNNTGGTVGVGAGKDSSSITITDNGVNYTFVKKK